VLLITHRDELAAIADVASLMCAGSILFTGTPAQARQYFTGRCLSHLESLGAQPWNASDPQVQAALASNGDVIANVSKAQ
jgi:ABC-type multidrug transport system ATPase subunit